MKLENRVAIVTGGGQGIGKVYSQALAEEGAAVVIADINFKNAQHAAEELTQQGYSALAVEVDVSNKESVHNMVQKAVEVYQKVDILINNAAIFSTITMKPFEEIPVEDWDQMMAVNLRGVFLCCQAVSPYMRKQKYGKIINISSLTALIGSKGYAHYITSKAGVIGITRALAQEMGQDHINVNTITPTGTLTEIPRESFNREKQQVIKGMQCLPIGATAEHLLGTIIFLASDDSSFITGQILNVDGGLHMH